jgi:hypothetical protein
MAQAYDVKLEATAADTVHHLVHAINADGAAGTDYYTGTSAHPSVTAAVSTSPSDTAAFWLTMIDASDHAGVTVACSYPGRLYAYTASSPWGENGTDTNPGVNPFEGSNSIFTSVPTADGLVMSLQIMPVSSASCVAFYVAGSTPATLSPATDGAGLGTSTYYSRPQLRYASGRTFQVMATGHNLFVWLSGDFDGTAGTFLFCGIPKLLDVNAPSSIHSVADNGSGLIRVVTNAAHGLTTGDIVRMDAISIGGAFNAYCNTQWTVSVVDATTFDCQDSTYPGGTHNEDTGVAGKTSTITSVAAAFGNVGYTQYTGSGVRQSFRTGPSVFHPGVSYISYTTAQTYLNGVDTGGLLQLSSNTAYVIGGVRVPQLIDASGTVAGGAGLQAHGGIGELTEAVLVLRSGSWTSTPRAVGVLHNAFVAMASVAGDTQITGLDSHNWINLTNTCAAGSLWITET